MSSSKQRVGVVMGVLALVATAQLRWLFQQHAAQESRGGGRPASALSTATSPNAQAGGGGASPESSASASPEPASDRSTSARTGDGPRMHDLPMTAGGDASPDTGGAGSVGGPDAGPGADTVAAQMTFTDFAAAVQILQRSPQPLNALQKRKALICIRDYCGAAQRVGKAVDGIYLALTPRQRDKVSTLPPLPLGTPQVPPGRAPEVERVFTALSKKAASLASKPVAEPSRPPGSKVPLTVDRYTLFDGIAALEAQADDALTAEQAAGVCVYLKTIRDGLMQEYQLEERLSGLLTPAQTKTLQERFSAAERESNLPSLLLDSLSH